MKRRKSIRGTEQTKTNVTKKMTLYKAKKEYRRTSYNKKKGREEQ